MKPAISWDFRASRCGHNFEPQKCPSGECGYREALQKIAVLTAELDKLHAALKAVEWGGAAGCPRCCNYSDTGHAPDCIVGLALKGRE